MRHLTAAWARRTAATDLEDLVQALEQQIESLERQGPEAPALYKATGDYIREHGPGKRYANAIQVALALWEIIKGETGRSLTQSEIIVKMPSGPPNTASAGWMAEQGIAFCHIGSAAMANQVVVIHEAAHIILQMQGRSDKHGPAFQALNERLLTRHMGRAL